ncbi:MAG: hypothetical protein LW875_03500 [Proteobacteria bacterium]|jgi:hypothetical protein|nr:hypothetical protein [Pseudomonadota bacterium]
MNKFIGFFLCLLFSGLVFAQTNSPLSPPMTDELKAAGSTGETCCQGMVKQHNPLKVNPGQYDQLLLDAEEATSTTVPVRGGPGRR